MTAAIRASKKVKNRVFKAGSCLGFPVTFTKNSVFLRGTGLL